MPDQINNQLSEHNVLNDALGSKNFLSLTENVQNNLVSAILSSREQDGGQIGKLLGTNVKNATIHAVVIICIVLLIILIFGFYVTYNNNEGLCRTILETIIPVISLSIGYMFGKGDG